MTWNEQQYERIARYLDGEPIALTVEERTMAEAFRKEEADLAAVLAEAPSRDALDRSMRRVRAELARPMPHWSYRGLSVAAAAMVVAMIGISLLWPTFQQSPKTASTSSADWAGLMKIYDSTRLDDTNVDLDLLDNQLLELQAEMAAIPAVNRIEAELDLLESNLGNFWLDEIAPYAEEG
jgi:hypothetical protein